MVAAIPSLGEDYNANKKSADLQKRKSGSVR